MNEEELKKKISKGENHLTEFKKTITNNNELAKDISSFANSNGGQLFIGITNSGEITGIQEIDSTMRRIDDVAYNCCEPPITVYQEILNVSDKTVLIINIPKGTQRPYRTKTGQCYIRSANRNRQTSWEELRRLFQDSSNIFYDETIVQNASLTDIDTTIFRDFVSEFLDPDISENDMEPLLKNFHLVRSYNESLKPTLAGLLFFGKKTQFYRPTAYVVCAFIKGNDISIAPFDKKDIMGTIPRILEQTLAFVRLYLVQQHEIKSFEPEMKEEVPEFVLREAIVNAIAHRDYTISAPVRIIVFSDRVEIHSPGLLPNTVTIESMKTGGSHILRNPAIYNILLKMRMVTNMGSGIKRIVRTIKEYTGQEIQLAVTESEFVLTIPRKPK
ncbi:MAG: putative DNA binding domain-containing protein [Bacteroidia bacterium]|nr:putative DNA binding domain-containing protein [Bacteroidia bacterium]